MNILIVNFKARLVMKYKNLIVGLVTGFSSGAVIGILIWIFLHNMFGIGICSGIGMLIGIVAGTLIDYQKNNK